MVVDINQNDRKSSVLEEQTGQVSNKKIIEVKEGCPLKMPSRLSDSPKLKGSSGSTTIL